jgi:phosphoribosylglycinamide formyltransferase-1
MSVLTELPRIVILASGQGSLAAALMESAHFFEVAAVISDRREAPVLGRAEAAGINAISLPIQGDRLAWESALADQVAAFAPEFVVSAGFMRILSPRFLERFRGLSWGTRGARCARCGGKRERLHNSLGR